MIWFALGLLVGYPVAIFLNWLWDEALDLIDRAICRDMRRMDRWCKRNGAWPPPERGEPQP